MLELEHIQKSFDGVPVLKDISLQVEDGEIVSILGPLPDAARPPC